MYPKPFSVYIYITRLKTQIETMVRFPFETVQVQAESLLNRKPVHRQGRQLPAGRRRSISLFAADHDDARAPHRPFCRRHAACAPTDIQTNVALS